ncbi:Na+/H+ antiporter subunit E [Corynebacterium amycolatum]|uniref:Na+/H+ antiporter subunit E n=1 Tax=Corynebacterium amycolatum TaxID=43765 RepID=UPI000185C0DD|nr:Na+/H+ antiporter subunit E [Corynebacterium amycolatum]EEB62478.1 putative monovalent cation/H+ antiporter subunit E [Corynebacterium amycolatum SK46]
MKFLHVIRYSLWLVWQVVVAATDVVRDTLRPHQKQQPVLIGLPLRVTSDLEVTLFAESITMTPGTLVCGARETDVGRLFIIHAIFGADLDALYDSLYDMEEHLVPSLRDVPRPKAFVFEEYNADKFIDPDAVVGVAAEVDHGLPLPDGIASKGEDKGARS